jgi:hypothetical protein
MQEALLGRNALVCHGGYSVFFKTVEFVFSKMYHWIMPQDQPYRDKDYVDDTPVEQFLTVYWEILHGKTPSILRALLLSRERFASVKHDYIYGVLGIVELEGKQLVPDYRRSLFHISRDIFERIIADEGNLDVLSACELRNHYKEDPAVRIANFFANFS